MQLLPDFGIEHHAIDPAGVVEVALRRRLSTYDAAYLWLAASLDAPLATFDRRLGEAARLEFGAART
jgi:predicted nucleic acid-binding protein